MKNKILLLIATLYISTNIILACECQEKRFSQNQIHPRQAKMDNMLNQRLNLTTEQQAQLHKNRSEQRKEMEKIIKQMNNKHDEIRNVYSTGMPKYQADLKTAPQKAELVILKQNADKLREQNRKNFESILTKEQKQEFQAMRKEFAQSRPRSYKRN